MHGLNLYDYSARYYQPAIGRFTTVDPLAEKYYSISPYAYCLNNPLKYIDPTGMYFDPVNEKRAQEIEKNLNKQIKKLEKDIAKLEKKGKDIGDRGDRVSEMKKSLTDISDMRGNEDVKFSYKNASDKNNPAGKGNPTIDGLGTNDVTMYVEGNMGSRLHESRHGGDAARGTLTLDNYNVNHEVGAYRAQYAYDGKLDYLEVNDDNQKIALTGIRPPSSQINSMSSITPAFVNNIGTMTSLTLPSGKIQPGLMRLYPPKIWTGMRWHGIPSSQWDK